MKYPLLLITLLLTLTACNRNQAKSPEKAFDSSSQMATHKGIERAYFASGCFWCVEAVFESVAGVEDAVSGYSGGKEEKPTYNQVGNGKSTHAEAVEVYYNPDSVSFETLVNVFFDSHDPTTLNRQGPDSGPQYRSIAFYQNDNEKEIIERTIKSLNASTYKGRIVTQVVPFEKFWIAEDYHQDYERNNPRNPYIRGVSVPRLNKFKAKFPALLKDAAH
jgi:peptide-methionine (S)-S-oxide reductase